MIEGDLKPPPPGWRLERFFYLGDEDRKLIAGRRRDYNPEPAEVLQGAGR